MSCRDCVNALFSVWQGKNYSLSLVSCREYRQVNKEHCRGYKRKCDEDEI